MTVTMKEHVLLPLLLHMHTTPELLTRRITHEQLLCVQIYSVHKFNIGITNSH